MINPLIQKQLDKLFIAKPDKYDEIRHQFVFKKATLSSVEADKFYLIRIDPDSLKSDVVAYNMNGGNLPRMAHMKVNVLQVTSSRAQVTGFYYDADKKEDIKEYWSGWLPLTQISVVEEL